MKESEMFEEMQDQLECLEAERFVEIYNDWFGSSYDVKDIEWDKTEGEK